MIQRDELNRMRWAARRGMLELDLVLEPFVDQRYGTLDAEDRRRFQHLMGCEDQDLYAWLMQKELPPDPEARSIVEQILAFTRTPPADR